MRVGTYDWTADRSSFDLFIGDVFCATCRREGEADGPADEEPECQGSPRSCSSLSPGSCSRVRGRYVHTRYRYGRGSDQRCAGSPHACSSIHSADPCEQQGCEWE